MLRPCCDGPGRGVRRTRRADATARPDPARCAGGRRRAGGAPYGGGRDSPGARGPTTPGRKPPAHRRPATVVTGPGHLAEPPRGTDGTPEQGLPLRRHGRPGTVARPRAPGAHGRVRCMAEAGAPPPRTGFPPLHRPSPRAFAVLSPVRSARFRARTPGGRPTGQTAHPASAGSPTRPCRSRRSRGGAGAVVVRRRPPLGAPVTLGRSWPESTARDAGVGVRQWSLLTALVVVFLNAFTGAFPKFPI